MTLSFARLIGTGCSLVILATSTSLARDLTFEERVETQRAIERIYYQQQLEAKRPFDEAIPRELLERKVRKYLRQSVALERFWDTVVTGTALQRELDRVAASTRFPDRLRQIYDVLDNDPPLLRECLARPVLVDRLTRNFFAFDSTINADQRHEAVALRTNLVQGGTDRDDTPRPWISEIVRTDQPREEDPSRRMIDRDRTRRIEMTAGEFARLRAQSPTTVGEVGPVEETRGSFLIRVVLEEEADRAQIATYAVRKRSWDDWWSTVEAQLDPDAVTTAVAPLTTRPVLPLVRGSGPNCPTPDTWDPGLLDDAPFQRSGQVAVWTGSLMLIWGGHSDSGSRYDPLTDVWTPISELDAPESRTGARMVWTGSEMVVWGGTGESSYLTTGGRYNPVTDTWTSTSTVDAPQGRFDHTAVWTGTEMIVWGGNNSGAILNSGGRYDPSTDSWAATSSVNVPSARSHARAVWTGTEMIVWGGQDHPVTFNTGGRYDPSTDSWNSTTLTDVPGARTSHTAVWTGTRMIVWGGRVINGTTYNDGGSYDPITNSWAATSTSGAPPARTAHSAVWDGSSMLIWGGTSNNARVATGGSYDPVADLWTPTSTVGAPRARNLHSALWTGNQMIVWGGRGSSNKEMNTGGRYAPASDSWTPTSTGGPIPRTSHSAVWTGNLMIVWGGFSQVESPAFPEDTGGRYDPTLEAWTATSTANAPQPRGGHVALWTGEEMFVAGGGLSVGGLYDPGSDSWRPGIAIPNRATAVWTGTEVLAWGGVNSSSTALNTGTRYDPITGSSDPITTVGTPDARYFHGAVWTGSKMLVWGGTATGGGSAFNTGGEYDPATDSWVPAASGLGGRHSFSTVWTGEEMLVWGGSAPSGARYDPDTNTWTPISTVDEPSVDNDDQVVVWTGRKMIVWGSTFENTGGVYDPQSDTWSPTSTEGAPTPRHGHTGVWTGEALIVWGGTEWGSQQRRSDGSRYVVDSDDDGLADGCDNCPLEANFDQTNDDGDPVGSACDCDDTEPTVYPDAAELCDGINNDCADPDWPSVAGTFDADADADGWSICAGDCDDTTSATRPGAPELCNEIDDDCNGQVDEPDGDGDAIPDCVDNCPQLGVAKQSDSDGDGEGDACDADDGTIYVYWSDEETLEWAAESGFQTWNVYSADLTVMVQTGDYTQLPGSNPLAGRQCGSSQPLSTGLVTILDPGQLAYFLTSGLSGNVESDLGTDSVARPRFNANPCE